MLTLSDMLVPYAKAVNPYARVVEKRVEAFAVQHGIKLPGFEERNSMNAYLYPLAAPGRLVVTGKILAVSWFIDDISDRIASSSPAPLQPFAAIDSLNCKALEVLVEPLEHILRTGEQPLSPTPLEQAVLDVACDFAAADTPDEWRQRFARLFQEYLVTTIKSKHWKITDLDTYVEQRIVDSGMLFACALAEFAQCAFLSDALYMHPIVQELTTEISKVGALSNDLFSFQREQRLEGKSFNLLSVLLAQSASFDQAVHTALSYINESVHRFEAAKAQTPMEAQAYAATLTAFIPASWYWQQETLRYRSPDSPFPELRQPR
jgi:hypothetical protein